MSQHAALDWEKRWNESEQIAGLSQDANKVMAVGWFGYVWLDLNDKESVEACIRHSRAFADLLQSTMEEYEKWNSTSSSSDVVPQGSLRPMPPQRTRKSPTSGS